MENNETMTPGQMRQLIAAVTNTVPVNLPKSKANRLLHGKVLRNRLNAMWRMLEVDMGKLKMDRWYIEPIEGDVIDFLNENGYYLDYSGDSFDGDFPANERALAQLVTEFEFSGNRPEEGVELERIEFWLKDHDPVSAASWLRDHSYRSADFRELISYMHDAPDKQNAHILRNEDSPSMMGFMYCGDNDRLELYYQPNVEGWHHYDVLAVKL